jgi:hypothetical protein
MSLTAAAWRGDPTVEGRRRLRIDDHRSRTRLGAGGCSRGLCAADRRSRPSALTIRPRWQVLWSSCRQTLPTLARARPSSTAMDPVPLRGRRAAGSRGWRLPG